MHDANDSTNQNLGSAHDNTYYRLARGAGVRGGAAVAPLSMAGASAPSFLKVWRGPFQNIFPGEASGMAFDVWSSAAGNVIPIAQQQRSGVLRRRVNVGLYGGANDTRVTLQGRGWDVMFKAENGEDGLQVNPGETLSILAGKEGQLGLSVSDIYEVTMLVVVPPKRPETSLTRRSIT
jgi:hypothetical protein